MYKLPYHNDRASLEMWRLCIRLHCTLTKILHQQILVFWKYKEKFSDLMKI